MLCRYCGKIVYHDLKLCCFHGAKELSDYFIKQYIELGKVKNYLGADYEVKTTVD